MRLQWCIIGHGVEAVSAGKLTIASQGLQRQQRMCPCAGRHRQAKLTIKKEPTIEHWIFCAKRPELAEASCPPQLTHCINGNLHLSASLYGEAGSPCKTCKTCKQASINIANMHHHFHPRATQCKIPTGLITCKTQASKALPQTYFRHAE